MANDREDALQPKSKHPRPKSPPPDVTLADLYAAVGFNINADEDMVQVDLNLRGVCGFRKVMEPVQARHIGERLIKQADLAESWRGRSDA